MSARRCIFPLLAAPGRGVESAQHPEGAERRRGEERRVVTTLFCDLVGFTALSERNDPELIDAFLRRYYAVPSLHEDDPERAVRAGLRLVDEVDALPGIAGEPVEVRVGVNTGEVLVRLNVNAARLVVTKSPQVDVTEEPFWTYYHAIAIHVGGPGPQAA